MGKGDPAQARGEGSGARRRGGSRGALTWAHLAPAHRTEGKMAGGRCWSMTGGECGAGGPLRGTALLMPAGGDGLTGKPGRGPREDAHRKIQL